MVVLGTTIHEFASGNSVPPTETVDGRTKSDHDDRGEWLLGARYFRNRNSRPIFTRFTPLYSMMSAVA